MLNDSQIKPLYIKSDTIKLWLLFILLLFLAGFRWDVGIDWGSYMGLGEHAATNERLEPANLAIKLLLFTNGFTDGGYWLWVMAFLILFFFFYSFWKYSAAPLLSAILFICLGPFFDSLNGVRQYTAIALFVYSWQFIFKKQCIRYLIVLGIGSLFHQSILLLLPFYWLSIIKYNKKVLITLCILFLPLSFISDSLLPKIITLFPQYSVYEEMRYAVSNNNVLSLLRIVFPLFLFTIIMQAYDSIVEDRYQRILCNLSIFSILVTVLFPSVALVIRLGFYFQAAFLFLIPILCRYMTRNNALAFKIICIGYGIGFVYFTQISKPIAKIWPFQLDFRLADANLLWILLLTFICSLLFIVITEKLFAKKESKNFHVNTLNTNRK